MPIYMGESQKTLFKGDYHPAEFYKGGKMVTGYETQVLTGQDFSVEGTYNEELHSVVRGNGVQNTTTGKNLINPMIRWALENTQYDQHENGVTVRNNGTSNFSFVEMYVDLLPETTYTLSMSSSGTTTGKAIICYPRDTAAITVVAGGGVKTTFEFTTPPDITEYALLLYGCYATYVENMAITYSDVQIERGSVATSYEPYTGGMPAPSPSYPQTPAFSEGKVWSEGRNLFCNHFDAYTRPKDYRILPINLPQGTYYFSAERIGHIVTDITIAVAKFGESYSDFKNDIRIVVDSTGTVFSQMVKIDATWTSPKLAVYCKTEDLWNELFTNYHVQLEKGMKATPCQPYRSPASIDLPVLRAIPDGNGGFSARDSLTFVEGMPGWYDLRREVWEEQVTRLSKNDETPGRYLYYYRIPDAAKGTKLASHFQFGKTASKPGFCTDFDFAYDKVVSFQMEGIVSKDNSEMTDSAEANAWLQAQSDAGTPLTVWYPLETPTTERVYLGKLGAYPYYTHLYSDCAVKPQIEAEVKIIGGNT